MMSENKIIKYLNDQRKTGQFCDIIIKLSNNFQVYGHFCVLAPQSDFVGNKYFTQETLQFSIHNPLKIEICNFDCDECLCDIVDFMYSENITIFGEHENHIKHLSKLLSVNDLLAKTSEEKPNVILKVEGINPKTKINTFQYK